MTARGGWGLVAAALFIAVVSLLVFLRAARAPVQHGDVAAYWLVVSSSPEPGDSATDPSASGTRFPLAAELELSPIVDGTLKVEVDGRLVAQAEIELDDHQRVRRITPERGSFELTSSGTVVTEVAPSTTPTQVVDATAQGVHGKWTERRLVATRVRWLGGLALGNTFLEDVNVCNGTFTHQVQDLEDPRLGFGRTYSSLPFGDDGLGPGWSHDYSLEVFADAIPGDSRRYLVRGDAAAQVFTCADGGCTAQRGFHGTFRVDDEAHVTYRSKNGSEYVFLRRSPSSGRFQLDRLVDSLGAQKNFSWAGGLLETVVDRDSKRRLHFVHQHEPGRPPRVVRVELLGPDPEQCIEYGYSERGTLAVATRHKPTCASDAGTEIERYEYRADQLTGMVGNGVAVSLTLGAPNAEQAARVIRDERTGADPLVFDYSTTPQPISVLGTAVQAYKIKCTQGPSTTQYFVDDSCLVVQKRTGASVRSLGKPRSTLWDPSHILTRETVEEDGTAWRFTYDDFGNLIRRERTTSRGPNRPAQWDAGAGQTELWQYDQAFNVELCAVAADGTLRTSEVDSSGADPRRTRTRGTGLLLSRVTWATRFTQEAVRAAASCADLASRVEPDDADVIQDWEYCGVRRGRCRPDSRPGDLVGRWKSTRAEAAGPVH